MPSSVRSWLSPANVPTRLARDLIDSTVRACFAADLSEVSLLNWLFLVRASGGVEALMSLEGGYQDSQFEGGVGQIPDGHGGRAGGRGRAGRPGHRDRPDRATGSTSPPTRCGSGRAGPCSPCPAPWPPASASSPHSRADHALLIHQMPAGTELKMVTIYDEPFWRADGANGATVATDELAEVTLDTTQPGHAHGVLATYAAGPQARTLWAMGERERRDLLLRTLSIPVGTEGGRDRSSCSS